MKQRLSDIPADSHPFHWDTYSGIHDALDRAEGGFLDAGHPELARLAIQARAAIGSLYGSVQKVERAERPDGVMRTVGDLKRYGDNFGWSPEQVRAFALDLTEHLGVPGCVEHVDRAPGKVFNLHVRVNGTLRRYVTKKSQIMVLIIQAVFGVDPRKFKFDDEPDHATILSVVEKAKAAATIIADRWPASLER